MLRVLRKRWDKTRWGAGNSQKQQGMFSQEGKGGEDHTGNRGDACWNGKGVQEGVFLWL